MLKRVDQHDKKLNRCVCMSITFPSLICTDTVVSCAVVVLKSLIQTQLSMFEDTSAAAPSSPLAIVANLARRIDDIRHPEARACVIWLVGQYSASTENTQGPDGIAEWSPDVLRKTAKSFRQEVCVTIQSSILF